LFILIIIAYTINKKKMFTSDFSRRLAAYFLAEKTFTVVVCVMYEKRYKFNREIDVKAYTKKQARKKALEIASQQIELISNQGRVKTKNTFY
jgi:hypothetical protein